MLCNSLYLRRYEVFFFHSDIGAFPFSLVKIMMTACGMQNKYSIKMHCARARQPLLSRDLSPNESISPILYFHYSNVRMLWNLSLSLILRPNLPLTFISALSLSIYLSIYLSVCLSVYLSIYLSLSLCLSLSHSLSLTLTQSLSLSHSLSFTLSFFPSFFPSFFLPSQVLLCYGAHTGTKFRRGDRGRRCEKGIQ